MGGSTHDTTGELRAIRLSALCSRALLTSTISWAGGPVYQPKAWDVLGVLGGEVISVVADSWIPPRSA